MRVSEIYSSVQGEGPGIGHLTQFLRFAGCNLRCAGWACDTQHAIDPEKYRQEWKTFTTDFLVDYLTRSPSIPRVTLTGGEPFLQKADDLVKLANKLLDASYHIEVFTNGTLGWQPWVTSSNVTIIMDWKLPGSGESRINLDTKFENLELLGEKDAVKFVCVDKEDFHHACAVVEGNQKLFDGVGHLYVGVAWGKLKEADLVEWMKLYHNPFKLNVQMHNYIYDRNQREI